MDHEQNSMVIIIYLDDLVINIINLYLVAVWFRGVINVGKLADCKK